jgi:hypothetical protein
MMGPARLTAARMASPAVRFRQEYLSPAGLSFAGQRIAFRH